MRAETLLREAIAHGELTRAANISSTTHPDAARTYLSDGTALAWQPGESVRGAGTFVIDAEIPSPVRPSLIRRYGIDDAMAFATAWTRAEALAKLADLPIITWLGRYRLDVPPPVLAAQASGLLAWHTNHADGVTRTRALIRHERVEKPAIPGVSPLAATLENTAGNTSNT